MKCFYHSDIDGKCAGAMVARKTNNYSKDSFIEYNYDGSLPTEKVENGEDVYIVDLSFTEATLPSLMDLIKRGCNIVWCDHHKSSIEVLKNHPELNEIKGIRKEGISGAALTYMYLFDVPYDNIPTFIKYVSEFDCWLFKSNDADCLKFKYAVELCKHDALDMIWNRLIRDDYSSSKPKLNEMLSNGDLILKFVKEDYSESLKKHAYESEICGYRCLVINKSCNSLVFGDKIKKYPVVAVWTFNGERYKYSIYTDRDDIDCSKIAESFGGGGHQKASGFTTKELILKR